MTEVDITSIIVVVSVCISSILVAFKLPFISKGQINGLKKEVQYWKDVTEELEQEIKVYKGKLKQKEAPPQFKGEVNKANVGDLAKEFFPVIADKLPKWAQPFFKVPVLQQMAIDYFVQNPDTAMNLIGKFFSNKQGRPALDDKTGKPKLEEIPPGIEIY